LQEKTPGPLAGITLGDLNSINEPAPPKKGEDLDNEAYISAINAEILGEKLSSLKQDRAERKSYANRIFILISAWLLGVFVILILSGFGRPSDNHFIVYCKSSFVVFPLTFSISDKVLMTLIGGTTATVLGLFAIVANYLFPKRGNSN
jgi:hypothetical protein